MLHGPATGTGGRGWGGRSRNDIMFAVCVVPLFCSGVCTMPASVRTALFHPSSRPALPKSLRLSIYPPFPSWARIPIPRCTTARAAGNERQAARPPSSSRVGVCVGATGTRRRGDGTGAHRCAREWKCASAVLHTNPRSRFPNRKSRTTRRRRPPAGHWGGGRLVMRLCC